jgi:hypothetical protein
MAVSVKDGAMRIRVAAIVALAATVMLSACTTPPAPGLDSEQRARIASQRVSSPIGSTNLEFTYVSLTDWGGEVTGCMSDAGYKNYNATAASFVRGGSAEMTTLEEATLDNCLTQVQVDPVDMNILSREQLNYIYSYFERRLVPCLAAHGITVTDLPTREKFLSMIFIDDEFGYAPWSPYEGFSSSPQRIFDDCPPSPPGYAYALEDWRS